MHLRHSYIHQGEVLSLPPSAGSFVSLHEIYRKPFFGYANGTTKMILFLSLLLLFTAAGADARPAQPFRVVRREGGWQLLTPSGMPIFSLGVCCVNMGAPREEYNPQKPEYAAWREYTDPNAWADATLARLKSWGFTTIGGWSDFATLRRSRRMDRDFAPVLHLGASAGVPWFDMWDPSVIHTMEEVARAQILPLRDDPRLLGYYTDNEMGWWNAALWKLTLAQKPQSGQRQRLLKLVRDRYHGHWGELLKDFDPEGASSFPQLAKSGMLFLRPGSQGIGVMRQFLGIAAERYYQLVRQIIRQYDRRGLILGDRYQSFYYPEVARAAASLDAVSTNLNANWNDGTFARFYLDTLSQLTRRPIMIGEFYMTATENRSGNRNDSSGFPVVATQRERAAGFRATVSGLMRTPYVIGADWFQYYDEPTYGRPDGENYDMGLVDINDVPYREVTSAATSLPRADREDAPPVRRADASSGIPPAPAAPMAELRPTRMLKDWDRERGFVRPASRFPVADLYLCWASDAVYLGLQAMDTPEPVYYRDGQIPEVDRMEWIVYVQGRPEPIRVRIGAGRGPTLAASSVTVASPSTDRDVRPIALMKIPAATFGRRNLRTGDRFQFTATLVTEARADRVDWKGTFGLAR
jgi:hypothetical protein